MSIIGRFKYLFDKNPAHHFNEGRFALFEAKYKELARRDAYRISLCEICDARPSASKIGGLPYIPVGEAWPVTDNKGRVLPFIAQIRTDDLVGAILPDGKVLAFFGALDKSGDEPDLILKAKVYAEGSAFWEDLPSSSDDYAKLLDEGLTRVYSGSSRALKLESVLVYADGNERLVGGKPIFVAAAEAAFGEVFDGLEAVWQYIGAHPFNRSKQPLVRIQQDFSRESLPLELYLSDSSNVPQVVGLSRILLRINLQDGDSAELYGFEGLSGCQAEIEVSGDFVSGRLSCKCTKLKLS